MILNYPLFFRKMRSLLSLMTWRIKLRRNGMIRVQESLADQESMTEAT